MGVVTSKDRLGFTRYDRERAANLLDMEVGKRIFNLDKDDPRWKLLPDELYDNIATSVIKQICDELKRKGYC
jgi:hypothetical protein